MSTLTDDENSHWQQFAGNTDCIAKDGEVKTFALKKGGGWTPIGGWKRRIQMHFIYLRLSSQQNPCGSDPSGVCMDYR